MGIENSGSWKYTKKEQLNAFLSDAENVEQTVERALDSKNKAKEHVVQTSSNELSMINADVLASNEAVHEVEDVKNVNDFLANLSEQTKETLGKLRFEGLA
jgi:hypothetical protein